MLYFLIGALIGIIAGLIVINIEDDVGTGAAWTIGILFALVANLAVNLLLGAIL